jgi:putative phage-type endonuclease
MYNNDELIDITELIIPDEETPYFNADELIELYQTCLHLMEEFIKDNPTVITEPDFDETFDENMYELMHAHFETDIFYNDDAEDEMGDVIEHSKIEFFNYFMPPRSYSDTIILNKVNREFIDKQLTILRNKPQPVQRTKEWYEFRHGLITASNAYKAFESQTVQNQLIYEKCQPLNQSLYVDDETNADSKQIVMVNTNTPLHWGQKYEPLSVQIYEHKYNTKIEDFGCIQHETYLFMGASPDGINIDESSPRYGRMLEIKNIVNREIDGIPKKEYWIQMQLQMEVCNLNECDFLETKFIEYPDYMSYVDDTEDEYYEDDDGIEFKNLGISKDNKMKGSIIYFHTKEGKPLYVYRPLDLIHPCDIENWHETIIDKYQRDPNYEYIRTIYWKLEYMSCVLVCRNRQWFKDNVSTLEYIWSIITKERDGSYEHRAPNRREKKDITSQNATPTSAGCFLKWNKDTGKITIIKKDIEVQVISFFK